MAVQTKALAAYVLSRNARFAGGPVTLARLAQMYQLPFDAAQETVDAKTFDGVARYFKMTVAALTAAIPAPIMIPPVVIAPVPVSAPLPTPKPVPPPAPEPPAPATPAPIAPEPTVVIPKAQLTDLVAASRKSEPVIEAPAPVDDHEIDISFEDVEATPAPERETSPATPKAKAKKKSSKKKKG